MEWWSPGSEALGRRLRAAFQAAVWPQLPPGFVSIGKQRPMRIVAQDEDGHVVKWARPVRVEDHVSLHLRGGKGVREGRALRRLEEHGIAAPIARGYTDEDVDLLVVDRLPSLAPLPPWPAMAPADVQAVAALLGRTWAAGIRQRDLTRANLGLAAGSPTLVDLGSASTGRRGGMLRELARARASVFGEATATQRLRALRAWLEAADVTMGQKGRRALTSAIEQEARRLERRYRRGRDRRATRDGRHFATFQFQEGGRGVRRQDTPETWEQAAGVWMRDGLPDAVSMKGEGRVMRATAPNWEDAVVAKRYGAIAKGRLPRSLRAFRLAAALENRGVATPRALLAVAAQDGSGILLSAHVDADDLHAFSHGGHGGRLATLTASERHALAGTLGGMLRRMHDAEVTHRDLKAPNLLVRPTGSGFEILVGDLDGARIRKGPVPWRRRARDLARLDASLDASAADRRRVLEAYLRAWPRPPIDLRTLTQWIAEAVARKRGPSGLPR